MSLADDVNLDEFVMTKDDLSGADIKAICTESGLLVCSLRCDLRFYFASLVGNFCFFSAGTPRAANEDHAGWSKTPTIISPPIIFF